MIYHLFQWFEKMGWDIPGANLMNYISFRGAVCIILALVIAFWIGPKIIHRLQKKQIGETIRDLGLEGQLAKKGTPTMGGIIILAAILIPVLLFCKLDSVYVLLLIFTTICLGAIGFKDDSIKVFKKNKDGMKEKNKIFGQLAVGLVVGITLLVSQQNVIRLYSDTPHPGDMKEVVKGVGDEKVIYVRDVKSRTTTIPFLKHNEFKYSWLAPGEGKFKDWATNIIYVIIVTFIIIAVSNGTNLTDGMDGLAAGTSAIVPGIYGRHRISGSWRHHSRGGCDDKERVPHPDILRNILRREPERADSEILFQVHQSQEGRRSESVQDESFAPPFPEGEPGCPHPVAAPRHT